MHNIPSVVQFEDISLSVHSLNGQRWLTATETALAMGYADPRSLLKIYSRHADEFTEAMTCVVNLTTQGQRRDLRVFNADGAHLLGMFSHTPRAKAFRRWVLAVLKDRPSVPAGPPVRPGQVQALAEAREIGDLRDQVASLKDELLEALRTQISIMQKLQAPKRVPLSESERAQILALRASGLGNAAIGKRIGRSDSTVESFIRGQRTKGLLA
ncbi:BRO family protein [Algiphilus sp. W345]|uniref:BRO family protein n=1 Tax=Banduia mediterranea TaxID=3075609 RepID=A0ABU2WF60_9GAMM|nr:BRO family protein [Algiphilus sp. W345]MDT0496507.1 BRO family protein [Algiphilus sp. W345]